ncbi:MAG: hypothetical protein E6X95_14760 [Thomasclavelia ramosa]|nr:hypothetical protein [Thomasclavelia ramosa]
MSDIYSILNQTKKESPQRLPKEEFIEKIKQQKNSLYEMSEVHAMKVISEPSSYIHYLSMLAQLDYTVANTLLVMAQKPDAMMLKDSEHWRKDKHYIKKGEKGIQILEPQGEYERPDGSVGTNYAVKYVFDVSQINSKIKVNQPFMSTENIFTGLTYNAPVHLLNDDSFVSHHNVLYSPAEKTIFYRSHLSENELVEGMIREFCYAEFDQQYTNFDRQRDRFIVESSAYILCSKLGVKVSNMEFANEVSQYFSGMDARKVKEELTNIKDLSKDVYSRIERGIYKTQQQSLETSQPSREMR